ncbi:MAG: 3-phosphoshikimate 1-carboxyvinyltransferase [Candidatus Marinimicrobia bacterium]|nr:3-phosphoshikimate 1-carboxyvinyltransferase [Candidatus Neomarinimicrobiota bacterium]
MIRIKPLTKLKKHVLEVPGSKYIANRVLMLAALADGVSTISNVPENNDINHAIEALTNFGIDIIKTGDQLKIRGSNGKINPVSKVINVGESGTLMRFITAVSALSTQKVTITGSRRITERPVEHLIDALAQVGVKGESPTGCPPVSIEGGEISGGEIRVKGNISSQFISGLLLVAPFAKGDLKIVITSELVSVKYVDMTINAMKDFGVNVQRDGYREFFIPAGQKYQAQNYSIPGDWSSASYFLAAAALLEDEITLVNMNLNSAQGEAKFYEVLKKMGCDIITGKNSLTLKSEKKLRGVDVDMGNMPDVAQTLAAIAPFAQGKTTIRNIEHLRYKECDRIDETAHELRKIGVKIFTTKDSLIIEPSTVSGGQVETHNDHRMAMSLALCGLKAENLVINNPEVSAKSFPNYWQKLQEIGVEFEEIG